VRTEFYWKKLFGASRGEGLWSGAGWPGDVTDDEALVRLLALNLARSERI
jgi:hypothetical protein